MLVDGAVAATAARVCQVSSNRSLEEALAALARELAVVLPRTLVAADDALDAGLLTAVATSAAAGRRSSERRTLVVLVVMLACRRVVVGATSGPSTGTVDASDAEVGAGLLQLVRPRQSVNCAERRHLHGPVHRRRVLHVSEAASST